jgi:hypothetical protein
MFAPPTDDELKSSLFDAPTDDERKSADLAFDPPGVIESGLAGAAQGATLGHADELAGLLGAVYDKGEALLGKRGDISFGDAYRTRRDAARRRDADQKKANPKTYTAGEIGGGIASAVATGGALGAAGNTQRALGLSALGGAAAGSGYSKGDLGSAQHMIDTGIGAALGPATYAVGKAGEKTLKGAADLAGKSKTGQAVRDYLTKKLKTTAGERAAKAAIGQNKRAYQELAAKKGGVEGFGRKLLDTKLDSGKPLIRFGNNVDEIGEKALTKLDELSPRYNQIYDQIDEMMPEGAVDPLGISDAIMRKADQYNQIANRGTREKLLKEAEAFMDLPQGLSMKAAQAEKNAYRWKPGKGLPQPDELSPQLQNEMKRIVGSQMDEAAERASPEIAAQLKNLKAEYGPIKQTAALADDRRLADLSNRFISPSDHAMGLAGLMSNLGGLKAAGLALANKQVRTRGNAATAVAADKLANIVKSSPQIFGKYASVLQAANDKGAQHLGLTHQILWKNDPQYRALFSVDRVGQEPLSAKPPREK